MNRDTRCPSCIDSGLKSWSELNADEREVVKRLPAAREYSQEDRQRNHRWCTRCWHETANSESEA